MKKTAFTLAEVLFALLIIGVIMAILIPALNKSHTNNNVLLYKKTITDFQDAINAAKDDPAYLFEPFNYNDTSYFLDVTPDNFCKMISDQLSTRGSLNCDIDTSDKTQAPSFQQAGGAAYWNVGGTSSGLSTFINMKSGLPCSVNTPVASRDYCARTILVDVNGPDKGKNELGNDQFRFLVRYDGDVSIGTGGDWDTIELVALGGRNIGNDEIDDFGNNDDPFIDDGNSNGGDSGDNGNTGNNDNPVVDDGNGNGGNNGGDPGNNDDPGNEEPGENNDPLPPPEDDDVPYTEKCIKENTVAFCEIVCNSIILRGIFYPLHYCKPLW